MDYSIKLKNGTILRGLIQSPGEKCRAMIVFVHGVGEHILRYDGWADMLNEEGIGFTGVDLPGHGRSDGRRGNIRSYSVTDEMIDILLEGARKTFPGIPLFIYGQSMGGGIVLDYLLRKRPAVRGAIATSPWLKLAFEPDKFKLILASVMRFILPGLVQPSGLVVKFISRDNMVVDKYITDPLVHDKISLSLFHSAMRAARHSLSHAAGLTIPLLLMHGSDDQICSSEGSSDFASKAPSSTHLKIWDGGYHELHNDLIRNEVFRYLVNWINSTIS